MNLPVPFERILEFFQDVSRDIGRNLSIITRRSKSLWRAPTYSWGRSDYAYWDRAYYCRIAGLEVAGLFIKPIVQKIPAWVLGRLPKFVLTSSRAQERLENWFSSHHEDLLRVFEGSLKHGDAFFVINSDLSVSLVPPDSVDPIVDENDYSKRIGWRIRQVFPNPDDGALKQIITDEYYIDRRVHTVEFPNKKITKKVYPNVIGMIPVVHVANHPGEGEQFGHPEAEALIDLLHRYGQVLEASVEGNILQGRPTPVIAFNTVQDLNAFWRRYGSKNQTTLPDGTVKVSESIALDLSDILTVSGAQFDYKSPGSFATDVEKILGLLFYLIIEHLEIPEFVFGNAIEGSKASAETQMPVFEVFITARQKACTPWITATAKIVQAYQGIINVVKQEDPLMQWEKLTQNGRLVLDTVNWAFSEGLLDEETALILLPLDIADPKGVLKQAKKDKERRQAESLANAEATMQMQNANTPPNALTSGKSNPNPTSAARGSTSKPDASSSAKATQQRLKNMDDGDIDDTLREEIENLDLELA